LRRFTTNWALYDTTTAKKKQSQKDEEIISSKEIQKKIKLIEKAFS
jgi:hypothetical protein